MKRLLVGTLCLGLLIAVGCAASYSETETRGEMTMSAPNGPISISYFYDNLSQDGRWFQDQTFGWCWTPYDVDAEWRPYSDGHWEYTDDGWSWASDEPWGWATYHYGRWFFNDDYGWAWVPGTDWAPAWVAWRDADDYVGWAPLPPAASWNVSVGLSFGDANAIPWNEWCFVPRQHVFDSSVRAQVYSVGRNVTLLERSRDATRFEVRSGRPANVGPDIARIEATLGRQVPRQKIVDVDSPSRGRGRSVGNGSVGFFRPPVQPVPAGQAPTLEMQSHRNDQPAQVAPQKHDQMMRKMESDLSAERSRMERDQQNEMRAKAAQGAAADELRKRHDAEKQAFEQHAAQQRKVFEQRMQKQVVRPDKNAKPARPQDQGNGNGNGNGRGKGHDKGDQ